MKPKTKEERIGGLSFEKISQPELEGDSDSK